MDDAFERHVQRLEKLEDLWTILKNRIKDIDWSPEMAQRILEKVTAIKRASSIRSAKATQGLPDAGSKGKSLSGKVDSIGGASCTQNEAGGGDLDSQSNGDHDIPLPTDSATDDSNCDEGNGVAVRVIPMEDGGALVVTINIFVTKSAEDLVRDVTEFLDLVDGRPRF